MSFLLLLQSPTPTAVAPHVPERMPALLTLVFFLWDAFQGAPPSRRRDPRWIWQTALLVALGVIVVVWNLGLRG